MHMSCIPMMCAMNNLYNTFCLLNSKPERDKFVQFDAFKFNFNLILSVLPYRQRSANFLQTVNIGSIKFSTKSCQTTYFAMQMKLGLFSQ